MTLLLESGSSRAFVKLDDKIQYMVSRINCTAVLEPNKYIERENIESRIYTGRELCC